MSGPPALSEEQVIRIMTDVMERVKSLTCKYDKKDYRMKILHNYDIDCIEMSFVALANIQILLWVTLISTYTIGTTMHIAKKTKEDMLADGQPVDIETIRQVYILPSFEKGLISLMYKVMNTVTFVLVEVISSTILLQVTKIFLHSFTKNSMLISMKYSQL